MNSNRPILHRKYTVDTLFSGTRVGYIISGVRKTVMSRALLNTVTFCKAFT